MISVIYSQLEYLPVLALTAILHLMMAYRLVSRQRNKKESELQPLAMQRFISLLTWKFNSGETQLLIIGNQIKAYFAHLGNLPKLHVCESAHDKRRV